MKLFNPKLDNIEEIKPDLYIHTEQTKKGPRYKVVYPPLKDPKKGFKSKNIHWKNMIAGGRWTNLLFLFLILIIIFISIKGYQDATRWGYDFMDNPEQWCLNWTKIKEEQNKGDLFYGNDKLDFNFDKEVDDGRNIP